MTERISKKDYTWKTQIASYDVGPDLRLRPSSQLKLQQEVGEKHLNSMDLPYMKLLEMGIVFVLVRLSSVIYRAPVFGEPFSLTTWHRNNKGPRFYRCYRFTDGEGNLLIDSVSAFAIVDPQNHRPLRPSVFEQAAGVTAQPERTNTCPDPDRWTLPDSMAPAGRRRVRWSDLDCNNHLGNTVYTDIALDTAVAAGFAADRPTRGFSLAFQKEALLGDELALALGREGADPAWVSATLERDSRTEPCFEMCLRYGGDGP